jgi:arsenate reductase
MKTILFLCNGNAARSILAEAIMTAEGAGRFQGLSAGSRPQGKPNPQAIRLLETLGHDTSKMRSKSWDEFAAPDAPGMDFIFTLCDDAAGEVCPLWPGHPMTAHWGLPDPAAVTGSKAEIDAAFAETYKTLLRRIQVFTALPLDTLDSLALKIRLNAIGQQTEAPA